MIGDLGDCGITQVWAYQKQSDGTQMQMYEFADSFFSMLLDIQKYRPNLIDTAINIINDYGLSRSERRGATTRSQDAKVTEDVINRTNCWNIG